jgi:hypothetical protein
MTAYERACALLASSGCPSNYGLDDVTDCDDDDVESCEECWDRAIQKEVMEEATK